jgi:phosphoglycolate phosphatase
MTNASLPNLRRLVLFDIDGTLLWPDGLGRVSLIAALERVYGTAGTIESFFFGGRTDREIVRCVLTPAGIDETTIWDRFDALRAALIEEATRRLPDHNVQPCPGTHALIEALAARQDFLLGLLTGNVKETAFIKLEAAGFRTADFRVGAYGDEAAERDGLPPLALARAEELTGHRFAGKEIVIVGDTVADITCGSGVGARSIVVCTGWVGRDVLAAANPDFLFDDFQDTGAAVQAIEAEM